VAHTDNLTLASEDKEPQTVYEVIPSFRLAQKSPRVTSTASYRAEGYHYQERGENSVYNFINGDLRVAPDPDNFFLDLGASRDRTLVDPRVPVPSSSLPITTNLVNRDEAYFGPAFTYPLGTNVTADGGFRRTLIRYNEQDAGTPFAHDYDFDEAAFALDNYRKQRGLTWATRYASQKTEYTSFPSYEYRQASVELGAWAGPQMRVFGSGGKESAWDKPFDPSLADSFWEVGVATRTDARITAELAAGQRSFGSSRRVEVGIKFEHGSLRLQHSDAPTTQRPQSEQPVGPYIGSSGVGQPGISAPPSSSTGNGGTTAEVPPDLLTNLSVAERYLLRLSTMTLAFDLPRTELSLVAFDEQREQRIRLDGTPLPDESQTGVSLSALRRFGARTSLVLGVTNNHVESAVSAAQDWQLRSLTVNYDIGPRTRMSLEYAYTSQDSNLVGAGFDYSANVVTLLVTRTFNHSVRDK